MSRLDELITELCPDGVAYRKISDLLNYEQPTKYIVKNASYNNSYMTPVLTAGQSFILGYTNEMQDIYEASKDRPVIIFDDFTTAKKWVDFRFKVKSSALKILTPKHNTNLRYIFYCMENIRYSPVEHSRQWIEKYSKVKIPVPPLPVQEEIVRILDNFAELTAELTAELSKRKQQYQYYRDMLLTFDSVRETSQSERQAEVNNLLWKTLKDICQMKAGKAISASEISKTQTSEFCYECFGGNGVRGYVNKINKNGEFPIIGRQGALCGNVKFASGAFYATEHAVVVSSDSSYIPKFLYYLLQSMKLNQYKSAGAQPGLSVEKLEKIIVPVPSLDEQKRIVAILDRFDALCNDLTSGLPAEIEARKKQYEYYRDKLLTFKEAV